MSAGHCPHCKQVHEFGPYVPKLKTDKDGKQLTEFGPEDVTCSCGAILRHFVPVFKQSESGAIWAIIGWRMKP